MSHELKAITGIFVPSGSLIQGTLASGTVTSGALGNAVVFSGSVASGQINTFSIASGAITSDLIAASAVTSTGLAANAVTSGKITSGAVTLGTISSGAISSGMLADNSVVSGSVASGVINQINLASGAIFPQRYTEQLNTGLLYGGTLSYTSGGSVFSIGSGLGMILVPRTGASGEPTLTYVQWNELTNQNPIYSGSITYVSIRSGGAVQLQNDAFTLNEYLQEIVLGYVVHLSGTVINSIEPHPSVGYAGISQLDTFARIFGPLKVSGLSLTANGANLQINRSAGTAFAFGSNYETNVNSPSVTTEGPATPSKLIYMYRSATAGRFTYQLPVNNSVPGFYDNGTGTLATTQNNSWTIQRLFYVPGETDTMYVYYGRNEYANSSVALQNIFLEPFTEDGFTLNAAVCVGYLIVRGAAANLSLPADAVIVDAGIFRNTAGGGGGVAGQSLNDLTDVSAESAINNQFLMYNGGNWVNSFVLSASIASGAVVSGGIASGQIGTYHIAQGAITDGLIASGAVTSGMIGNAAVTSGNIASGQIGINHFASGLFGEIVGSGTVGSGDLGIGAVNNLNIASGTISNDKLANSAITIDGLSTSLGGSYNSQALTTSSGLLAGTYYPSGALIIGIASGGITAQMLASGAVTSGSVASGQITATQLAVASGIVEGAQLTYDSDTNSLAWEYPTTVTAKVKNGTASIISGLAVVYISGGVGGNPYVGPAQANADATSLSAFGVATANIGAGAEGQVVTQGILRNVNTSAFSDGDILFLSPTVAGGVTTTKPQAPEHLVLVGYVLNAANNGSIEVAIQNGYEIEELHDVKILSGSLQSGQVLQYSSGVWWNQNFVAGSTNIGSGAVTSGAIASGQVGPNALASGVIAGLIVSGSVQSGDLGTGAVNNVNVASGTLSNDKLVNSSITLAGSSTALGGSWDVQSLTAASGLSSVTYYPSGSAVFGIASGGVIAVMLGSGAVTSGAIASGQIGLNHLASGTVQGLIGSGSVGSGDLGLGAVNNENIASGTVANDKLTNSSVTIAGSSTALGGSWAAAALTTSSGLLAGTYYPSGALTIGIASGGIVAQMIGSGAITSGAIASGQIGLNHLASGTVEGLIGSGSIQSGDLGLGAVNNENITSGTVANDKLVNSNITIAGSSTALGGSWAAASLTAASGLTSVTYYPSGAAVFGIASGGVIGQMLANGSVTSGTIGSGQVGAVHLASGALTLALSSGIITSGMIGNNAVISGNIASGQIGQFHLQNLLVPKMEAPGRLSLYSGAPVYASGLMSGKNFVYYNPYNGSTISLYEGSNWVEYDCSKPVQLNITGIGSGQLYDVYMAGLNGASGSLYMTLGSAWTSGGNRNNPVYQDGILVEPFFKYRYLGTILTTAQGLTEDTKFKRFVWNYDNRVTKTLYCTDSTQHTYNSPTPRVWDLNSGNRLQFVQGIEGLGASTSCMVASYVTPGATSINSFESAGVFSGTNYNVYNTFTGLYWDTSLMMVGECVAGYNYLQLMESCQSGTVTNVSMTLTGTIEG